MYTPDKVPPMMMLGRIAFHDTSGIHYAASLNNLAGKTSLRWYLNKA
jgi:hypothetical protein